MNMSDLTIKQIRQSALPMDAVTDFQQLTNTVSRYDIPGGQIISTRNLIPIHKLQNTND